MERVMNGYIGDLVLQFFPSSRQGRSQRGSEINTRAPKATIKRLLLTPTRISSNKRLSLRAIVSNQRPSQISVPRPSSICKQQGYKENPYLSQLLIIILQALIAANQHMIIVSQPFQLFLSPFVCRVPLCASSVLLFLSFFCPNFKPPLPSSIKCPSSNMHSSPQRRTYDRLIYAQRVVILIKRFNSKTVACMRLASYFTGMP